MTQTFLVGVTGGIGTGKSTVLRQLQALGARTLDADSVVHDLYSPGGAVHQAVARRYGQEVLAPDGTIDRTAVAQRVFADPDELAWLNELIHPLVKDRIWKETVRDSEPLFCAIPLLFEVKWEREVWRTVAVWCSKDIQMERLRQRGWDEAEINRRLAAQMSTDEKLVRADYALINNGDINLLRRQSARLLQQIRDAKQKEDL